MTPTLQKYWHIWKMTAFTALQEAFVNRWTNIIFIIGKAIRLAMSLVFLFLIRNQVSNFQGYTTDELIVFFLVYLLLDSLGQTLYRGVYEFSSSIRDGNFDFDLIRPVNPLFRTLLGKPDINDTLFLLPVLGISGWILSTLNLNITLSSTILFGLLFINSWLLVTALHILIMAAGILLVEVDGLLWLYRDLSRLGRFPVTIYLELMRFALFFLVPIGFMITIPAEVLVNAQPSYSILLTSIIGVGFFIASLRIWAHAVRQYSSASS